MPIARLQDRFGRIFTQRCFYLFMSLIVLVVAAPIIGSTSEGRLILNVAQTLVLIAAVAAVGRAGAPFVIALLLGIPAVGLMVLAQFQPEDAIRHVVWSQGFFLAFYLVAVSYLLKYVFNPEVMSEDKLFGAAAGYLMIGIVFAYAYNLLQYFDPLAFGVRRGFYDLLYMSFGCLTSNGPGDVLPASGRARALVMLEQVIGTLFVAILVARLAGIYPQKTAETRKDAERVN